MGVSKNKGTPKSSILIGFSIINHPFWVPLFWKHPYKDYHKPFIQDPIIFTNQDDVHGMLSMSGFGFHTETMVSNVKMAYENPMGFP